MKRFYSLFLFLLCLAGRAQESVDSSEANFFDSPSRYDQKYQMAFVISDVLAADFTAEGYYNFDEHNGIGLRLTAPGMPADQNDEVIYKALRYGYGAGVMHRIYFPTSDFKTRYYYIRTGLHYQQANLVYYAYDFFPETDDFGNEVLTYGRRRANETVLSASFDLALGYQAYYSAGFYWEFYLGLERNYLLNKAQLHEEAQAQSEEASTFDPWLYEGVRPIIGLSFGFGRGR